MTDSVGNKAGSADNIAEPHGNYPGPPHTNPLPPGPTNPFPCGGTNEPPCAPQPATVIEGVGYYTAEEVAAHGEQCYHKGRLDEHLNPSEWKLESTEQE